MESPAAAPAAALAAVPTPATALPEATLQAADSSAGAKRQRSIAGMLLGTTSMTSCADGKEEGVQRTRQKTGHETKMVVYQGADNPNVEKNQQITVYVGKHAAEDSRWVLILNVKENGTKQYLCVRCGRTFIGTPARVVNHCLRITGQQVNVCLKTPTVEQKDVLERLRGGSSSTALSSVPLSESCRCEVLVCVFCVASVCSERSLNAFGPLVF